MTEFLDNLNWIKVITLDVAGIVTLFSCSWLVVKNKFDKLERTFQIKTDKLENRLLRSEENQAELSRTCTRRDELKSQFDPVHHQLTEIRQRLDHLFKDK